MEERRREETSLVTNQEQLMGEWGGGETGAYGSQDDETGP